MDIKTEREALEAWYCRNHTGLKQSDLAKFRTLSGYSFSDSLKINISWEAWQAAKAQAVPEGFVLVNKKDLVKVLNCVTDDWLVDTDSFEEFKKIESLAQDEVNAMIEAQENST